MIKELFDLLNTIDNVEDMDVIAYHVRKRHQLLADRERLERKLKAYTHI